MLTEQDFWLGLGISMATIAVSVSLHYEGLRFIGRWGMKSNLRPKRLRVSLAMLAVALLHVVEIWFYGGVFWLLAEVLHWGAVLPTTAIELSGQWMDYIYFSATNYTSLGFGDVVGTGVLTMMTGLEALNGLVLITWSASFTYLLMERLWDFKK